MGQNSQIQWTDHTWNPWMGCEHVSPGCDNCYMFTLQRRWGKDPEVVTRTKTTFNAPLKYPPGPARVFTCSMSDWFIKQADEWRPEAWAIIKQRPDLHFQILTKRHGRIASCLPPDWGEGYPNVWLGVSVENQEWTRRIRVLREVPAAIRFLSIEPMIGPVDLRGLLDGIHWVIVGGESGSGARLMNLTWVRDIIDVCAEAGVACFVKQLGVKPWDGINSMRLKDSHGGEMEEWPEDLRVRQFPELLPA